MNQEAEKIPLVSLVVPVYNSMPYLVETLDAIENQGLTKEQLEVILVNDGSDDGSDKVLAEYAEKHSNYRLLNQPNSGGPADPCNKGIAAVTGKYFFVVGSDDVLTEGALGDLAAYAEKHGSDIVLAKMAGLNGRHAPGSMFKETKADAHLVEDSLFNSLTAIKLFRTDLVKKTGAHNPTHLRIGSDQPFTAACYLAANKVSVCADRPYVMIRKREDGKNVTSDFRTSLEYIDLLVAVVDVIVEWTEPGELRDGVLHRPIHGALRKSLLPRFLNLTQEQQEKVVSEIQRTVAPHFSDAVAAHLASLDRVKVRLALEGRVGLLRDVITWEKESGGERLRYEAEGFQLDLPAALAEAIGTELFRDVKVVGVARLEDVVVENGNVHLKVSAYVRNSVSTADSVHLRLRRRHGEDVIELAPLGFQQVSRSEAQAVRIEADIETSELDRGVWDIHVVQTYGQEDLENRLGRYRSGNVTSEQRVLRNGQSDLGAAYFTKGYGNLSLDIGYTLLSPRAPAVASISVLRVAPDREVAFIRVETIEPLRVTPLPARGSGDVCASAHLEHGILAVALPAWSNQHRRRMRVANAHGSIILRVPEASELSLDSAKQVAAVAMPVAAVRATRARLQRAVRRLGAFRPQFLHRR